MQTIVLATQKGGAGKTTLAISLALAAIRAGHNVRLIETDTQGSLSNWRRRRPHAAPIVEPIYAAREVERRLQSLARSACDAVKIDHERILWDAEYRREIIQRLKRLEEARSRVPAGTQKAAA